MKSWLFVLFVADLHSGPVLSCGTCCESQHNRVGPDPVNQSHIVAHQTGFDDPTGAAETLQGHSMQRAYRYSKCYRYDFEFHCCIL